MRRGWQRPWFVSSKSGLSGLAIELRRRLRDKSPPVIIMTGEELTQRHLPHVAAILSKPIVLSELLELLRHIT